MGLEKGLRLEVLALNSPNCYKMISTARIMERKLAYVRLTKIFSSWKGQGGILGSTSSESTVIGNMKNYGPTAPRDSPLPNSQHGCVERMTKQGGGPEKGNCDGQFKGTRNLPSTSYET